jgi:hypothetical protein
MLVRARSAPPPIHPCLLTEPYVILKHKGGEEDRDLQVCQRLPNAASRSCAEWHESARRILQGMLGDLSAVGKLLTNDPTLGLELEWSEK